jgi:hypothetical protein
MFALEFAPAPNCGSFKPRDYNQCEFPTFAAFGNTLATTAVKSVLLYASSKGDGGNASASRLRKKPLERKRQVESRLFSFFKELSRQ